MKPLPYVIVLAGNSREGHQYAKRAGLPKGRHRVVYSAKQVRRLRSAEIHILPSFKRRPDRHGILAALRYTRGERFDVTMPPKDDLRGELTDRQLETAYRYDRLRDTQTFFGSISRAELVDLEAVESHDVFGDIHIATEVLSPQFPPVDQGDGLGEQLTVDGSQEPVEQAPVRKRRSRCKVCSELVMGDDDPAHDAAAHEAHEDKLLGKPEADPFDRTIPNFFGGQ